MSNEAGSVDVQVRARLDQLPRDLQDTRRHLEQFDRAVAKPTATVLAFNRAGQQASHVMREVGQEVTTFAGGPAAEVVARVRAMTLGFAVAAGAITGLALLVGGEAVRAFAQLENEMATYNAVLKATGFASGKTGDDIEKLAEDIRKSTTVTEGEVRKAAGVLATFGAVSGDQFDQALKSAQDLATVMGGNIVSSAQILGRALQDPVVGMTMLRRAGILLSEAQKRQIKDFTEVGQTAKAAQVILDEVQKRTGGAGAASGGGLVGAYNQLGEATNNLLERWGKQIATGLRLNDMFRGLAGIIDSVNKGAETSASPEGKLAAVEAAIAARRERSPTGVKGIDAASEKALNRLLERRVELLNAVIDAEQKRFAEGEKVAAGQQAAADQKQLDTITAVSERLKDETRDLRLTALGLEVVKEQRAAGVAVIQGEADARSELQKQKADEIAKLVAEQFYLKNGAALLSQRIALLGTMATGDEVAASKRRDLNEAHKSGVDISKTEIAILTELAVVKSDEARTQERANYGLVTSQEAARQKLAEFNVLSKQYAMTASEQAGAMNALEKKYRDIYEASIVAGSKLPELTRASLDATNVLKQFDQASVGAIDRLSSGLADVVTGAKDFKTAMAEAAAAILRDLAQMIIKAQLYRLIMAATGIGSSGGTASGSDPFGGSIIPGVLHGGGVVGGANPTRAVSAASFAGAPLFAAGLGASAPGINEVPILAHKGELVGWPEQFKRAFGGGGDAIKIDISINLEGANGDETIRRIAYEATAAGVQSGLSQYEDSATGRARRRSQRGT